MKEKLLKIQRDLIDVGVLYCPITTTYDNVEDFIFDFLTEINRDEDTYNDKEFNDVQCYAGAARSAGDIYRVCLSIFPNLSFEEFIKALFSPRWFRGFNNYYHQFNYEDMLVGHFCGGINKRVYKINHRGWMLAGYSTVDEFGIDIKEYSKL